MMKKFVFWAALLLTLTVSLPLAAGAAAVDLLAAGRVDEATRVLKNQVQSAPNDAEAYNLLARAYFAQQRWDKAIAAGEHSVSLQPNNPDYHWWLARAYGEKADNSSFLAAFSAAKKARAALERAVELNASHVDARSDLAEFYIEAPSLLGGGKDKALGQANALSKIDPARSHWVRALIAQKQGDVATAESEYRAAIQASNENGRYWLDLAGFYGRAGRLQQMEDAVTKAVNAPQKPQAILVDAASLLYRTGRNLPGAAQLVRTYISSNAAVEEAPLFQAHYLLGSLLEKMGETQSAAAEYAAALNLYKGFGRAQEALKRVRQ